MKEDVSVFFYCWRNREWQNAAGIRLAIDDRVELYDIDFRFRSSEESLYWSLVIFVEQHFS